VAHAFTVLTLRRSILTEKVARRGFHVSREYAIDELEILFVRDVMNTDIVVLSADDAPAGVVAQVGPDRHERSQHLYPVLDDLARLVGAATFAEIAAWARDPVQRDQPLRTLAEASPPTVFTSETLRAAFGSTERRGTWKVPAQLEVHVSFGSAELDLREAELAPGLTTIDVSVKFGSVEIIVPPDLAVEVNVSTMAGSCEDMRRPQPTPPEPHGGDPYRSTSDAAPRVRITGTASFGSCEIIELERGQTRRDLIRRARHDRHRRMNERRDALDLAIKALLDPIDRCGRALVEGDAQQFDSERTLQHRIEAFVDFAARADREPLDDSVTADRFGCDRRRIIG
jgi:hypothetical protein